MQDFVTFFGRLRTLTDALTSILYTLTCDDPKTRAKNRKINAKLGVKTTLTPATGRAWNLGARI